MTTRALTQVINAVATSDGGGVILLHSLGQTQELRLDPFLMLDECELTLPECFPKAMV